MENDNTTNGTDGLDRQSNPTNTGKTIAYMKYMESTLDKIQSNLSISDYEKSQLHDILMTLNKATPESSWAAENRVNDLERKRVWIVNFLYMITDKFNVKNDEYRRLYDREFSRISKLNRPNKQSVDSEIHSGNPDLANRRQVLENFDNFKNFIYNLMKSMDFARTSAMNKWQSGRYGD